MSPLSHSSWHSCMLEFVTDRGPGAGERSGGQFEDALCGPNKRRQTEWRKLMIDAFYSHPPIDESHIDGKSHAERMDRLSRIDPQTFTGVQFIALKQTGPPRPWRICKLHFEARIAPRVRFRTTNGPA